MSIEIEFDWRIVMTNREFYHDKIIECFTSNRDMCKEIIEPFMIEKFGRKCSKTKCSNCWPMYLLWLNEEYVEPKDPAEDWEVDTKVYVSSAPFSKTNHGNPAYFKRYDRIDMDHPYKIFSNGKSSFTCCSDYEEGWKYCRLAEEGEE